jgi:predicted nuclease of restriction endonuclease-like RecB superfamily
VHPDFVLHDAKLGEVAMEVWGMDSPQYSQRKNEKIAHYSGRGLRLWQWNAVAVKEIPLLPAKKVQ